MVAAETDAVSGSFAFFRKMMPVRCYTCNATLSDTMSRMEEARSRNQDDYFSAGFAENHVHRMCCQRMFLGYIDLTDDLITFSNVNTSLDTNGTVFLRHVDFEREVACD